MVIWVNQTNNVSSPMQGNVWKLQYHIDNVTKCPEEKYIPRSASLDACGWQSSLPGRVVSSGPPTPVKGRNSFSSDEWSVWHWRLWKWTIFYFQFSFYQTIQCGGISALHGIVHKVILITLWTIPWNWHEQYHEQYHEVDNVLTSLSTTLIDQTALTDR